MPENGPRSVIGLQVAITVSAKPLPPTLYRFLERSESKLRRLVDRQGGNVGAPSRLPHCAGPFLIVSPRVERMQTRRMWRTRRKRCCLWTSSEPPSMPRDPRGRPSCPGTRKRIPWAPALCTPCSPLCPVFTHFCALAHSRMDRIWSFGPRRFGPNLLLNTIPGYASDVYVL